MNIEPISKAIYDKAKKLGIDQIVLRFSGGNDEGYLQIETVPYKNAHQDFEQEIDEWAWSVYQYSGAGDGSDYGDTITYDLANGEASADTWYHVVQSEKGGSNKLKIAKD